MTSLPDALAACARSGALEQRAQLLEALWQDLGGPRCALRVLPALLIPAQAPSATLDDYAVDLALAPDGVWRVLRDRVGAHPGAAVLQAPMLAAFLPALCRALLGHALLLPSWPTLWLRDADTGARLRTHPRRFRVGDALDPDADAVDLATATPDQRAALQRRVDQCPDRMVARPGPAEPSVRVAGRLGHASIVRLVTNDCR